MIAPKTESPRRLAISRRHALYPLLALVALGGLLFGPIGRQVADDMPEEKTHPYFPDQFWPYPILAMVVLVTLGLLALVGQPLLQPGQPADPRAVVVPRPEWYFLALFQFAKLGPALLTKFLIPGVLALGLILWPLLDGGLGPRAARRLGWTSWPVPRHNAITRLILIVGLVILAVLTAWAAFAPDLCIPWPYNGPVCAG